MRKLRRVVQEYFNTSEKEANGFLVLSFLMIVLVFCPFIYKNYLSNNREELKIEAGFPKYIEEKNPDKKQALQKFYHFNPNEIGEKEWQELGISSTISRRIEKYKAAGGQFKIKSDLRKIYGLPESTYTSLYKFILLPDSLKFPATEKKVLKKSAIPAVSAIDINLASSEDLKKVKGIGDIFSKRIIKFRDLLGGFYSTSQLYEVYGMDSTTVSELLSQCFISEDFIPEKINVNDSLLSYHPYLTKELSFELKEIKNQKGRIEEGDLTRGNIPQKDLNRLMPYLSF